MDGSEAGIVSDLTNLDGLSLAALDAYDLTIFATALAPLMRQNDKPTSSMGGHNS